MQNRPLRPNRAALSALCRMSVSTPSCMSAIGSSTRRFQRACFQAIRSPSIKFSIISLLFFSALAPIKRAASALDSSALSALSMRSARSSQMPFSLISFSASARLLPFPSPSLLLLFVSIEHSELRQHPLSCPSALAPIEVPYQRSSQVPFPLISCSALARLLPSPPLSPSLLLPLSLFLCRSRTQKATPRVALTTVSTARPLARPSQSMHSMRQRKEEDDMAQ